MTEDEARAWIVDRFGAGAIPPLDRFAALLRDEAGRQNLVSSSSIDQLWRRHVVDSAQLIPLAARVPGQWLDIGSGAGFPGIVIALLSDRQIFLVEPRKRRADFLSAVIQQLDLTTRVGVIQAKIQNTEIPCACVISARAVTSVTGILTAATNCAGARTLWILPKGRSALEEVADARRSWHGVFHVEQSVTDPESLIVLASKVSRR